MIVIAASLITIGALLAYSCHKQLMLAWASRRWPKTTGHISRGIVQEGVSQGLSVDGTLAPVETSFRELLWIYTYAVHGRQYQSSQFSFSMMGWQENTRNRAEGDEVTVYYCPTNPSIAVIRPGLQPILLTGPIIVALGLGLLVYGICRP